MTVQLNNYATATLPTISEDLNDIRRKAMTLAHSLKKQLPSHIPWSIIVKTAWSKIKKMKAPHMMYWRKTDGTLAKRIVLIDIEGHLTFKGTGKPLKPKQRLFVDVAKVMAKYYYERQGQTFKGSTIISAYEKNENNKGQILNIF